MSEISEAALRRKKAFAEAKESAGGVAELYKQQQTLPWKLYFLESGAIVCLTKETDFTPNHKWLTYEFPAEELQKLNGKDLSKYYVAKDAKEDSKFHIEMYAIQKESISAEQAFLYEVPKSKSRSYDLKVEINKTSMKFTMSKKALRGYADIHPSKATIHGYRLLKFFITADSDPHFLAHEEIVPLAKILKTGSYTIDLPEDLTDCGVYTNKLFDTYVRK